jgi:hypothetical protein
MITHRVGLFKIEASHLGRPSASLVEPPGAPDITSHRAAIGFIYDPVIRAVPELSYEAQFIAVLSMLIEHPAPSPATAKLLYGTAYRCAYKNCSRPLYRIDEQTGERTLNSRICHIYARRQNGPRWSDNQSTDHNRSEKNLVLMCLEHASAIDDPALENAYPPELLLEWKSKQLEEYDQLAQSWALSPEMAEEVIKASSNLEVIFSSSTVHLGGEGGRGPGAGGLVDCLITLRRL